MNAVDSILNYIDCIDYIELNIDLYTKVNGGIIIY